MPAMPTPSSGGRPESTDAGQPSKLPHGKPGGEIVISREEALALTALETDDGPQAHKRASAESGLTSEQVKKLQKRAEKARNGGFTLRGGNLTLKPKNYAEEGPGLLGDIMGSNKHVGKATKGTPASSTDGNGNRSTKEAFVPFASSTRLHECGDSGQCAPCRLSAARRKMREAVLRRGRRMGRSVAY